jgi:hypothetical protein
VAEQLRPIDQGEQTHSRKQNDLQGDRQGGSEDFAHDTAKLLLGQRRKTHVQRIADESAQKKGHSQGDQGQIDKPGCDEELSRRKWRDSKDRQDSNRPSPPSLKEIICAGQVPFHSFRQTIFEMTRSQGQ